MNSAPPRIGSNTYSEVADIEVQFNHARLERETAGQLKLAGGADGGLDLACVGGEITGGILEDGFPVSSQGKRTLRITGNTKIRMVEQIIGFDSNGKLPVFSNHKILVQRWVKLRESGPPQDVASGIAKLTGRRHRKSTWVKPA